MNKQHINTLEEFENICLKNMKLSRYNPKQYLMKYNYSQNILLDIFCTDYMIWCFEDYYSNDFNLDMITKYQLHINIDEFKILLFDLSQVLELVKRSELILELIEKNKSMQSMSSWVYEEISDYWNELYNIYTNSNEKFFDIVIRDYIDLLAKNKCSIVKKFYNPYLIPMSKQDIIMKAKHILDTLPKIEYSIILPLE